MTIHAWVLAFILLAPLTAQAATPPQGWWVVDKSPTDSDLKPGTAVRFAPEEIDWILAGGDIDRWQSHLEAKADHFVLRKGRGAGSLVKKGVGWTLAETEAVADDQRISLRAASSAEATGFDKTLSAAPDVVSTCSQAHRCCQEAMKSLGSECSLTEEFPPPPSLRDCQRFFRGIAMILEAKSTASPASCVAPKSATAHP